MHTADNDFFEEYKHLDNLCGDMYSCRNGVSEYLAQMEDKFYQGQYRISSWDSDYKMLKHVRWVRNQIAHNSGTYQISEPADQKFVHDFYIRIFSGEDSLTLLRKAVDTEAERRRQQKKQQTNQVPSPTISHPHTPLQKESRVWIGILIGIVILAFIALTVLRLK